MVELYSSFADLNRDFRNLNLFKLLITLVKGNTVVDVGCGAAFFAKMLVVSGKKVIGIEPSSEMCTLASKVNPEVIVIPGMAEKMDVLIKEPVDSVVMIDVLEHIEKDVEQIQKVNTILKDKGEFVFVVPSHPFLYGKRDKQVGHYRRYTKKIVRDMLSNHGFKVEHIRHWNFLGVLPYIISEKILKKPLKVGFRGNAQVGMLSKILQKGLDLWFRYVENNVNFGFGLSIICVAKKI